MLPRVLVPCVIALFSVAGAADAFATAPHVPACASRSGALDSSQSDPIWEQVNSDGFGDPQRLEVTALEEFGGYLYAGTYNPIDPEPLFDGAQIFRSPDGVTWTPVTQPGFGNSHDTAPPAILDFTVFNSRLYAGTGRGNASQVWRSLNGVIWAPMNVTGFGDPENVNVSTLVVYNGMIYAGVTNQVTGAQVWRSFTGDNNTWEQVAPAAPGSAPASITGFAEFDFDGGLYAAVAFEADAPAQIWRSYGGDWEIVVNDGFGDGNTLSTGGMAVFLGKLYVGAGNANVGAQLWHSADGNVWTQAIPPGFGDANNREVEMVSTFQNQLYVSVQNAVTGIELWRTPDGTFWEQVNPDGFGDQDNGGTNRSNAATEFLGQFCVGTSNVITGGELWRLIEPKVGLPDPLVNAIPKELALLPVRPNPSTSGADIVFDLPNASRVEVEVYDVVGRRIARLDVDHPLEPGRHLIRWDAPSAGEHSRECGVFFVRLRAGRDEHIRSFVLLP